MSARFQQLDHKSTTPTFTPTPFVLPTLHSQISNPVPTAVPTPGTATNAQVIPVLAAGPGPFTSYPPVYETGKDADEELLHTYASFREEPVTALWINPHHNGTWTLSLPVPAPPVNNPTLLSLHYMIKYATIGDLIGSSTIQTDTLLTTKSVPGGVITQGTDLGVYMNEAGYAPRMVDHSAALSLSTALAVKGNGGGEHWNHYVDNQRITPNVRVVDEAGLHVLFHVYEYPTARTVRSLSVEVSATWQKEEVEIKAREEADRKAKEAADKAAKDEEERRAREAEEKQAREEAKQAREEEAQWRDEERRARAEEKQAREEERRARDEERQWREEERRAREEGNARQGVTISNAPAQADEAMQDLIAQKVAALGLETCGGGFAWAKTATGYQCGGGGHSITFEQLGLRG